MWRKLLLNKQIKIQISLYRIFSRAYFHLPFLVIYFYKLGFNLITIECIMAVYGLAIFMYTRVLPIKYRLSSHLSCKKILLLSEGSKCIGLLLMILVQDVFIICCAQVFLGLGYGISAGSDTRLINYYIDDGGKFQAKSNSFMFASLLIAGLTGSFLFNIDTRIPFAASIIADVITGIVCLNLPKEPGKVDLISNRKSNVQLTSTEKKYITVYCLTRGIILTFFTGFLPYHLFIDLKIPIYGFIAILTSYTFLGNISSNFIAGKLKPGYAMNSMNICLLASVAMYFSNDLLLIIVATILLGLSSGATRPVCMTGLRNAGSNIPRMSNIMESIYSIINITLLITGGILYQYYGFRVFQTLLLLMFGLYILLYIYYIKRSGDMKILINKENGYLPRKYSKHAEDIYKLKDIPVISFPITFKEKPAGTKSFAISMIDYDAVSVCGFPWIHWVVCNIPGNISELPENASVNNILKITQGKNSFSSHLIAEIDSNITCHYAGPTPPDKDHKYTIDVYALDCEVIDLKDGFYLNELYEKIENHILAKTSEIVVGQY